MEKNHPCRIVSVATAVPPHRVSQSEAKEEARKVFADLPDIDRLIQVYDRAGVEYRHLAFPKSYYIEPRSFGERNRDFIRIASSLGEDAVRTALSRAEIEPGDVDLLIYTTTTGLSTPSVDALIAHRLGLPTGARRIPLFGLGCAGGAGALSIAADQISSRPDATAVVISVELCSLSLIVGEISKVNLVGTALFADGAAAAVLVTGERTTGGAAILDTQTHLFPETSHFMGWEFSEKGLKLQLSPQVPAFIAEALPQPAKEFLSRNGLTLKDVNHFALHPGGREVLAAYQRGLKLTSEDLGSSRHVLRQFGNLSSASVLFALDETIKSKKPKPGDLGFLAAMGPGFAAEMLLLKW